MPEPVDYLSPANFIRPHDLVKSSWHEHAPFAFYVTEALRPRTLVELGTQDGFAYLCFCQAVQQFSPGAACFAVDAWEADGRAGRYGADVFGEIARANEKYSEFSTLVRSTPTEAALHFSDGSVDLLHLDGRHSYDEVREDFETWLPKMSRQGIVLMHDTNVRERGSGVFRLFEELGDRFPTFEFRHGNGLGVLAVGEIPAGLAPFFNGNDEQIRDIRSSYARLGAAVSALWNEQSLAAKVEELLSVEEAYLSEQARLLEELQASRHWQAEHAAQAVSLRWLRTQLEDARRELNAVNASRRALEGQLAQSRALASALQSSTIWQATVPLRRLIDWFRPRQLPDAAPAVQLPSPAAPEAEGKLNYIGLPLAPAWPRPRDLRVAVLLHCYYLDQLESIATRLRHLPQPLSLFVTTDTVEKAAAVTAHFATWTGMEVETRVVPNRGRDVAPRFVGLADVIPRFDLLLCLHTKKSTHADELSGWADQMLDDLAGSPEVVDSVLRLFESSRQLGIVAPRYYREILPYIPRRVVPGEANQPRLEKLARALDISLAEGAPLDFPAGSMFWARPGALEPLLSLGLKWDDFEEERGQKDATLAHAVERAVFLSAEDAGFRWCFVGAGEPTHPLERCISVDTAPSVDEAIARASVRLTPVAEPASPEQMKQRFRTRCKRLLDSFLAGNERISLPTSATPKVSLIVVLYNNAELTLPHLQSLRAALAVPSEVILVDNNSTDRTGDLLDRVDGARIIRNPTNRHYLLAVNQAAKLAQGEYLLLLNNDTRVERHSIANAARLLDADPTIGAVGAKVILLDGTLQEAGSIVWNDGACLGYGRGDHPDKPAYAFRRDVDYCSAVFLMLPRALMEQLGGFDEAYAPAYYEDSDLCMRVWEARRRVVYEPSVEISHFEFGSSASSKEALALQQRHRAVFVARHREVLQRDHLPTSAPIVAARSRRGRRRLLIIDDRVPFGELGAGYPRAAELLRAAAACDWAITFYPLVVPAADLARARDEFPPGIEFATGLGQQGLEDFLAERTDYYDAIWVSRPPNMRLVQAVLSKHPRLLLLSKLIYDAEALTADRDALSRKLTDEPMPPEEYADRLADEAGLARAADVVVAVNAQEAAVFDKHARRQTTILGHSLEPNPGSSSWAERRDLLFFGSLVGGAGSPNVDSLLWFAREVMPRLDELLGTDYRLLVAGVVDSAEVEQLQHPRIELLGQVPDLASLADKARVFVAPTRFAAGIPHKVHQAAAFGLPAVTTPLLARQLAWHLSRDLMVGEGAEEFAQACARLYRDEDLWSHIRQNALERVAADCNPGKFGSTVSSILGSTIAGALQPAAEPPVRLFVEPGHYYSPIVDPAQINGSGYTEPDTQERELAGVKIDGEAMRRFWNESKDIVRSNGFPKERSEGRYYFENGFYAYGDGIVLNLMVRRFQPRKIIEVGSGFSSACILDTLQRSQLPADVTFIDPDMSRINELLSAEEKQATCLEAMVQDVPLERFTELEANDILFIDSSHVAKAGSDVNRLYFDVLPSLAPGVLVHVHDIFYPFEYPRGWVVDENRSWNETYLLRAMLTENDGFEIVFFNDYFGRFHSDAAEAVCPDFLLNPGGAIWLRRTDAPLA